MKTETPKTETPRTDYIAHLGLSAESYMAQMTDHARQLERELNEAREIAKKYEDRYFEAIATAESIQERAQYIAAERDNLKSKIDILSEELSETRADAQKWKECAEELASALTERVRGNTLRWAEWLDYAQKAIAKFEARKEQQ